MCSQSIVQPSSVVHICGLAGQQGARRHCAGALPDGGDPVRVAAEGRRVGAHLSGCVGGGGRPGEEGEEKEGETRWRAGGNNNAWRTHAGFAGRRRILQGCCSRFFSPVASCLAKANFFRAAGQGASRALGASF